MKQIMFSSVVVLCCGLAVAQPTGPRVGILTDGVSDFWTGLRDAAMAQAAEQGVALDFRMPSPATSDAQQELARQMLESGVQALAVCPVKPAAQKEFINELAGKTVLLTLFSDVPGTARRAFLGRDESEAGRQLGELVKASVPEGLKVLPFCKDPLDAASQARLAGFEAAAGELFSVEKPKADQGDKMLASVNIGETLQKRPEIAGLIGLEEYQTRAMARAVVEKGRARMVRVVGFGSTPDLLQALQEGIVHGLVVDDAQGAAPVILNALKALATGDAAFAVPEDGCIRTPVTTLKTGKGLSSQEMIDALKVQVPWISEATPGQP